MLRILETGLNPAVVFISVLTGSQVGGLLGLLLAVPTAGFIKRIADSLKGRIAQNQIQLKQICPVRQEVDSALLYRR